ncbi:MAG: prepilin-type N-terminal cleavage/methylation domain-containing protein [Candidatus Falkowbacteria bacterium]
MKNKSGFTLLEILLYIAITSILMLAVSFFMAMLLEARIKNQTIAEVEQQGLQVMQIITQTTRNATIINAPSIGTSSSTLSVNTYITTTTPTVFYLASSTIRMTESSTAAVDLNNGRVLASNLLFLNLSRSSSTPGGVRIQFTLSSVNTSGRNEYNFTKTFISSAALR